MTVVATDEAAHGAAFLRALEQWAARGSRWAVIPVRLVDWASAWPGEGWARVHDAFPGRCLATYDAGTAAVPLVHLCLLDEHHERHHGWERAWELQLDRCFAEQMDPVQRIARRAAHAAGLSVGAIAYVTGA